MVGLRRPKRRAERAGVGSRAALPPQMDHGITPAQELLCRHSATKTSGKVVEEANAVDLEIGGRPTGSDQGDRSVMTLMSDAKGLE